MQKNTEFKIPEIKLEVDKKGLVSYSGIHQVLNMLNSSGLKNELLKCLPDNGSNRSFGNYELSQLLIASLLSGHHCLDDIHKFKDDDLMEHIFKNKMPTPKTLGNFLRKFSDENVDCLKKFLTLMGYTLRDHSKRVHSHKGDKIPHFKIDGTHHEQHGGQIEGTGWMKTSRDNSVYGLASQVVFDELGFCFAGELLPASKPKGHPDELLNQVLSPLKGQKIDNPFEKVARVSGDSAYLTEANIKCLQSHHALFTIAAPRTINWHQHLETREWKPWVYDSSNSKKKRNKQNTEGYVSRWHWSPSWSKGVLKFPVIIKKEWREDEVFGQSCGSFHYHAVATNEDLFQKEYQDVIAHYRPRAEVENMIKEFKINFDAKHLPCLSFRANEVYFLFVLIAQNLIRWIALLEEPDKPHYAKKIREQFIFAPGRVLRGSRQFVLRVKHNFKKEVERLKEAWRSEPVRIPLNLSSA